MTMSPRLRKLALTVHIICSVGLLGAIASFLALAVAGLVGQDPHMVRGAYVAMAVSARFVIAPLAYGALLTGVIQSLGTAWGLVQHYWVVAKLLITAFATGVLLLQMKVIDQMARMVVETVLGADLDRARLSLVVHAAGGLLLLLVPAALSVYKPRGRTWFGRRVLG